MLQKDIEDKSEGRVTNKKILNGMQTKLHFTEDMIKTKMDYAGLVMRCSSGLSHLQILEGIIEGKQKAGDPKENE